MSETEELFKDNGEESLEGVEQPEEGELVGGEPMAPDSTIFADLKDLEKLTFGTRWSHDESSHRERTHDFSKPRFNRDRSFRREEGKRSSEANGNVCPKEVRSQEGTWNSREGRPQRSPRFAQGQGEYRRDRVFIPPFEVQFYQEDKSFDMLLDAMRKTGKTYELFTVAKLILQKPERFVATIRRRPDFEGVIAPLYLSLLDDLAFESEHELMTYIIQHHIEEFFDVHGEVVEAPKGRFTCVHRCGITGKLLSAPNYHRYRNILRDHFSSEIHSMSFDRFVSRLETTKAEEDIQAWLTNMSQKVTYTPKAIDESVTDLSPLETIEGVKNYLLKHYKDRILREVKTVRVAGINCESMPSVGLVRSVQFFLQRQRQFPLDTSNNLRNRFRRAGFGIYRKGLKGISYVCAVKRKFRTDGDIFTSDIQSLIAFMESMEKLNLSIVKKDYIEAKNLPEHEVLEHLNWLIRQGYVVEYENGVLYLNPKLPPEKRKSDAGNTLGAEELLLTVPPEGSVIPLKMEETAIEKLSDGTIAIAPDATLVISQDVNVSLNLDHPGSEKSESENHSE